MLEYLLADGVLEVTINNPHLEDELLGAHAPFSRPVSEHRNPSFRERLILSEGKHPAYDINGLPSSIVRPDFQRTPNGIVGQYPLGGRINVCVELLHLVCRQVLAENNGFFVHAAGLVLDGEGWLFPGPSGHGKSTISRYGGFDEALCDEWCIIRMVDGAPWMWGTYRWSEGRTMPKTTKGVPLRYVCSLQRSSEVTLHSLNKSSAFELLFSQVLFNGHKPDVAARYFELASEIIHQVCTLEMAWPKEKPCADKARYFTGKGEVTCRSM